MSDARSRWIVSTDWLAEHLDAPDVVVVDGSWYLEVTKRDGYKDYLEEHIPGAIYFDIDEIADTTSPLPHMLPRPEAFASQMRKMGIGDGQRIVVYDGDGMVSAARVWWTFRLMGVEDVVILDGGLAKWEDEGRELTDIIPQRPPRHFTARLDHGCVRDLDDVTKALANGTAQVVDTRSAERFNGKDPEPRVGIPSGNMAGSMNVPATDLITIPDHSLKSAADIRQVLTDAGVDLSRPIISSCGSGVTAAILNLALEVIEHPHHSLFDGSWTEWATAGQPIQNPGPLLQVD